MADVIARSYERRTSRDPNAGALDEDAAELAAFRVWWAKWPGRTAEPKPRRFGPSSV